MKLFVIDEFEGKVVFEYAFDAVTNERPESLTVRARVITVVTAALRYLLKLEEKGE